MNKVRTSVAEMFIDDDGILQIKMLDGVHITLEKVKEYFEVSHQLTHDTKVLVMVDNTLDYSITDDAKRYASSSVALKNRIATAVVTNSVINRLMGSLYIKLYKPMVPTKMFYNEETALKWLKSFYVMPGDKFIKPKKRK